MLLELVVVEKVLVSPLDILKLDYYTLFEVPSVPFLDLGVLTKKYHLLALKFHPDRGEAASADVMAYINSAYVILKDPIKSAGYWLQRQSVPLQSMGGDLDLHFELRHQLETIQTRSALQQFLAHVDATLGTLPKRFLSGLEESLEKAANILCDWHFYEKLKMDVQQKRETCLWYN